jgi:hypothetical protein
VPTDWRTGDLFELRKINVADRRLDRQDFDRKAWREVSFGPVRIKIRPAGGREDLASLVPDDVLDNVSRRDPVREQVGFWTSGNRVFALANPVPVAKLIELCNDDLADMRFTISRTLRHAQQLGVAPSTAERLFDVLLTELQEHIALERD